ncbi:hypothetical protein NDU88_008145 [Pleurodeles waltl]|uniref:Uncharacterized protein n=1 Tax=Pleurodeles waltl TaxID=8319 RepID=A0AAV7PNY0_PLEWA|nr:hypothetical protein NDU88_008145 [Pleurodeles waltl]
MLPPGPPPSWAPQAAQEKAREAWCGSPPPGGREDQAPCSRLDRWGTGSADGGGPFVWPLSTHRQLHSSDTQDYVSILMSNRGH